MINQYPNSIESSASSSSNKITEMDQIGTKLEDLTEGCISEILSRTTPLDTCRSALVSKLFHSAAESDSVWDRFLPPGYQHIISSSTNAPSSLFSFSSKKELYLCLSPVLVDHGTQSFSLDRVSGKKCYMVGARQLNIAWQDEPRHWVWTSHQNSRFENVATLRWVCWFDIIGRLETRLLSPNTTYAAYLVFKLETSNYGFDQSFKSYVSLVRHGEDEDAGDQAHFKPVRFRARGLTRRQPRNLHLPREREDGWMELEMGDFFVPVEDKLVRMQVKEVEVLGGKSGIIVEGIEVRPK